MDYKRNLVFMLLIFSFIAASVIIAKPNIQASPSIINVPIDYAKIQWAVGNATTGDTIIVAAGIYDEQVVIDKSLTLQGAGDTTIIKPSSAAALTQVFDGLFWYGTPNTKNIAGIIVANVPDGSNVTIKNLKVDKSSVTTKPAGADYLTGIFYRETGGTIDTVNIVGAGAWSSSDRAYGIYLSAATNTASVQITGSTITNYDKNGIEAMGNKLTFNIHDNVLTGRGNITDEVQNGVSAGRGSVGAVNHNTISNLAYQPETWWATAILLYDYLLDGLSQWTVNNNTITNCQIGVIFINGNASAQGNTVNGGTVGLLGLSSEPEQSGTWTASFVKNTVSGVKDSPGYDNAAIDAQTFNAGASLTVTIQNNTLTGGGSTDADGVYVDGDAGSVTATISDNIMSGWNYGINLASACVAGATITGNNITGTYLGIRMENATGVQICDNRIIDFVKGGIVTRGAKNILVEENIISTTLHDVAPNGIDIGTYTGTNGTVKGNKISGCSWKDFTGDYETSWSGSGILVIESGDSLEIIGNVAHDCDVGMDIESDLMNITCNKVHNNIYGFVFWNAKPKVNYNNIYSNTQYGVCRTTLGDFTGILGARYNWWGDASGPYHATLNPSGLGNDVSDNVEFDPWLDEYTPTLTVTYPMEGAYLDSLAVIWVNGTITETSWMGRYPQINDTSFTLDLASWNGTYFAFYSTTAITDGIHSYIVNFTDLADITASDTVTFTVDTVPPVVDIVHPTNGQYLNTSTIWVNGTVTELNKGILQPAINDTWFSLTLWDSATGFFAFTNNTALPDGPVSVKVNFSDLAGNAGEDAVSFILDATAPTTPADFAVTVVEGNATFTWTAANDNFVVKGYYLELNGEIYYVGNVTSYIWRGLTSGGYTAKVWTVDIAGNNGTEATMTFVVAQKADIVNVECPISVYKAQWFLLNATVENVGNITGALVVSVSNATGTLASKTITLAVNQTSVVSFNLTAPTTLGSVTLNVTAGHDSVVDDYWLVTLDVLNKPPVASFTYSPEFPIAGNTVTFNASKSYDADGTINVYKWNFSDGIPIESSPSPTITHIYGTRGNYTVTLTVIDNEGAENKTEATIIIIANPTADFTYSPIYPITGETVTFNASLSEPNGGTIITYTWNFGDAQTGTGVIANHTYLTYGTYNVTLMVTDSEGLSDGLTQTIRILIWPTANFTYSPKYPVINQTVEFDGSLSYDPDGAILEYTWDFGDGNVTTVQNSLIKHAYQETDTYLVTLTLKDSDGLSNSITKQIIVYSVLPPSDIAVLNVQTAYSQVYQGYALIIKVTVSNEGYTTEAFNVTAYANNAIIETLTVNNLPPDEQAILTFRWNTKGFAEYQNYTISAYAHPVPGEVNTDDNTFVGGVVRLVHIGDVNNDGQVRVDDILFIALAFGSGVGDPKYHPNLDVTCDGKIRVDDILAAVQNFGWTKP